MKVRALNHEGIRQFDQYLDAIRTRRNLPIPTHLLTDEGTSTALPADAEVADRAFASRLEAAEYLERALRKLPESIRNHDRGLWAWLSLFYFDRVCPADRNGSRKPGQSYRHIPSTHHWYYYRHLILGPYRVLTACGPHGRCMLYSEFGSHGDFTEQLASRQELIVNRSLMELVDRLYFDPSTNRTKPAATSRKRAGTLRRLISLVNQLDLTYDLYSMSADELQQLLPREFEPWCPAPS